ncbi:MAG: AGE family epimerase/isomerase, partial [Bdellovibrionales bacterium]
QNLTKVDLMDIREQLFANGDRPGLCPKRQTAFDEVWSDFSVKSSTSRFWPQCERIKVASQLGKLDAAAQSMDALFQFFATKYSGLWYDIWDSAQGFREQPAKASSLYHIVGAIEQYSRALE